MGGREVGWWPTTRIFKGCRDVLSTEKESGYRCPRNHFVSISVYGAFRAGLSCPPASKIVLAVVGTRLRTCVQTTKVWVGVHVQCGCHCCNFVDLVCRLDMRPTFHSRSTQVVVAGVAMRADCPGAGGCPPPPHVFVRVRGFWCCGRVRK